MSEQVLRVKYIDSFSAQGGIIFEIKKEFAASTAYEIAGKEGSVIVIDDFLVSDRLSMGQHKFIAWLDQVKAKSDQLPKVHNPRFYEGFSYFLNSYDAILFENRGFIGLDNLMRRLDQDRSPEGLTRFASEVADLLDQIEKLRPKDGRIADRPKNEGATPVTASFPSGINPNQMKKGILDAIAAQPNLQASIMALSQDLAGAIKMDVRNNPDFYKSGDQTKIARRAVGVSAEAYKLLHDFAIAKNKPFAGTRGYFSKVLKLDPVDQLIFMVEVFEAVLALGKVKPDAYSKDVALLKRICTEAE